MNNKVWQVYLLECIDGSYYTGVSNNVEKRMLSHREGKGSKYVKSKGFARLLASKPCESKSEALKTEYKIKLLSRSEKLTFFEASKSI